MERNFKNGDFEKLLKQNADQYRMYPSEKVWKGIHTSLHTRRRWYGITAFVILILTGSAISFIGFRNQPDNNKQVQNKTELKSAPTSSRQLTVSKINVAPVSAAPGSFTLNKSSVRNNIQHSSIESDELNSSLPHEYFDPFETTASANNINDNDNSSESNSQVIENTGISSTTAFADESTLKIENVAEINDPVNPNTVIDEETEKKLNDALLALASQNTPVVKPKKQARLTGQVYFTPTVSYRTLSENKNTAPGTSQNYMQAFNVNNLVYHKPAMGLEFGFESKYKLDKNISAKAGLQFNINRYDIRAYSHPTEIATVAINNSYGVDSLASLSNYRNFNGNDPNWLENFYFQVAIPFGAEYIFTKNKDVNWGFSATIQPTYVLGDRAYLISSDYKNYAEFPDLIRRWNLSSGFETFIMYSTGKINWQVGPHVRYQHLSSFINAYPVKENLFAAGLKVAATLNKK